MKPRIYICRWVPEEALAIIGRECAWRMWEEEGPVPREVLLREAREAKGLLTLLTDRVDEELLAGAAGLRIVSNMAVGYDNIDVAAATARGVMATNTPGVLTETTADLAFALMLTAARRLVEGDRFVREGKWTTWGFMLLPGQDVHGATLGIVGMGRIGKAVARRGKGFGMRVLYYNRRRDPEGEGELGAEYRSLHDLMRESDFVSIHCPLTPETRGLIGEKELAQMKPTAVLVNTARGPIVDEEALYRALAGRRIWAAGLDVYTVEPLSPANPLLALDNVVVLPHIGSASFATRLKMALLAAENLVAGVTGRRPPNLLNPEVWREG